MELTLVNKENQRFFEPLMPESFRENTDLIIGVVDEGTACGVLAMEMDEEIAKINYLYVAEEARRKGIGSSLLNAFDEAARSCGADLGLCQFVKKAEEPGLDELFEKWGYEADELVSNVYVTDLKELPKEFFTVSGGADGHFRSLSQVSSRIWNQLVSVIEQADSQVVPDLKEMDEYDQECSFIYVKDQEPCGCILFGRDGEDYILEYLYTGGKISPVELMNLFAKSYQVMQGRGREAQVYINALTKTTEKMVQKMTGGKARLVGQAAVRYITY